MITDGKRSAEDSNLAQAAKRLSEYQSTLVGSFNLTGILTLSEPYRQLAKRLEENSKIFTAMLNTSNLKTVLDRLGRETPYNYSDFLIEEQYSLIEISRLNNFGTVEVMPQSLIREFLKVMNSEAAVDQVLLQGKEEISEQVCELAEAYILEPKLGDYGLLLKKSLEVFKDGHYEASQTLSTALWDSFIGEEAGKRHAITSIKDKAAKPNIEVIEAFSPIYDYGAYGPALSAYKAPGKGSKYSRNGTIHHLSPKSTNELNSIKAITIASGLLGRTWRTSQN